MYIVLVLVRTAAATVYSSPWLQHKFWRMMPLEDYVVYLSFLG